MRVVAVFAGDTHISDHTWASRSNIMGDSLFGFQQVVDVALKNKCPLFILGDCWELWREPNPTSSTVEAVRSQIDRLHEASCPLYYINGQHDNLTPPYWFEAIHSWPIHIGGKLVMVGDRKFFGVDFFEPRLFDVIVKNIPTDIFGLLIHQAWEEFTGSKKLAQLSLTQLPKVPLVISGDMHSTLCQVVGNTFCVSPGATHMRSTREPREHHVVTLLENNSVDIVKLHSRPVIDAVVNDPLTWANDMSVLQEQINARFIAARSVMPDAVAKPLVLLEDKFNTGIVAISQNQLENCHVIGTAVGSSAGTELSEVELLTSSSGNAVEAAMEVAARLNYSPAKLELLRVVVSGGDVLQHFGISSGGL